MKSDEWLWCLAIITYIGHSQVLVGVFIVDLGLVSTKLTTHLTSCLALTTSCETCFVFPLVASVSFLHYLDFSMALCNDFISPFASGINIIGYLFKLAYFCHLSVGLSYVFGQDISLVLSQLRCN